MTSNQSKLKGAAGTAPLSDQNGFSLPELLVVMAIFIIVIVIATSAFDRLLSTGRQESLIAAGQIEGVVGLEMLRRDVAHAGYGLPWSYLNPPVSPFEEVTQPPAADTGIDPTDFNEVVPHALACATAGDDSTNPGTDYLVIKSALLPLRGTNSTAGRWGYLNYSTSGGAGASTVRRVGNTESDLRAGDRVVVIASSISITGQQSKELQGPDAATFSFQLGNPDLPVPVGFQPVDPSRSYIVYGIAGGAPKMPYNRADYYVNRPPADDPDFKIPLSCNPGTGILFKAVASHGVGYTTPYPLLNCVGDMKVVYTLDPLGDGNLSYVPATSPAISDPVSGLSPQQLRTQLRSVTIYILTHEGKRDPNYRYPSDTLFVGPTLGATQLASVGKLWSNSELTEQFGSGWRNYRWKVYGFAVTPRNMQQ